MKWEMENDGSFLVDVYVVLDFWIYISIIN